MHREHRALRLTIFVAETDSYHHRPLYHEIVQRARKAGLAGASVFHGIDGFGPSHRTHPHGRLHIVQERPVMIIIIDLDERIHEFVPEINHLVTRGLIVTDPVDVVVSADHPDDQLLPR